RSSSRSASSPSSLLRPCTTASRSSSGSAQCWARADRGTPVYEIRVVRERRAGYGRLRTVRGASCVVDAFREHFEPLDREHFVVVVLDGNNRWLGFNVVSAG